MKKNRIMKKKKNIKRKEELKQLAQEYSSFKEEKSKRYLKTLEILKERSKQNPEYKFTNLYNIIKDEFFLFYNYQKLQKKAGALTKGTDETTTEKISIQRIKDIIKKITDNNYKFSPFRRIMIPKLGKSTMRPLTISNFDDRIIQEAIRTILNAIYEPEFQKLNCNYGFRENIGVRQAISNILLNGRNKFYAIEGDIEKAYDTVDYKTMIQILKKKIEENKFLKLIEQSFKVGYTLEDIEYNTTLGIPQGGIASPILFNIYMHEFDKFILNRLEEIRTEINTKENRSEIRHHNRSKNEKIYSKKDQNANIKILNFKIRKKKPIKEYDEKDKQILKNLLKEKKRISQIYRKTKSTSNKKTPIQFYYTRYADDWIIISNADEKILTPIKEEIKEWLEKNLKLNLSQEKTKITNITKEYFTFLGFRFKNNQNKAPNITHIRKKKKIKQRTTWGLFCDIDHERVTNRLKAKGFLDIKGKIRYSTRLMQLQTHEIVYRYKSMIDGIFNYYYPNITFKSSLSRYHYYLLYSCYKTIAARQKATIKDVIAKYTRELKITYQEKYKDRNQKITTKNKIQYIPTYLQTMKDTQERTKKITNPDPDFLTIHINLRTAFKIQKYCSISGVQLTNGNPIESHYVRSIKK